MIAVRLQYTTDADAESATSLLIEIQKMLAVLLKRLQ